MRKKCRARRWSLVAAATCSAAFAACEDAAAPPTTAGIPHAGQVQFYIAPGDSSWDYYAADVDVTLEEPPPEFNYTGPPTYRYAGYHVERTRGPNNVWSSVIGVEPYVPHGTPASPYVPFDVMRLEDDDAGTYRRIYDRTAALITNPPPFAAEAGASSADTLPRDWGTPPAGALSAPGGNWTVNTSTIGSAPRRNLTREAADAWLDRIILTPGRRGIRLTRLAQQLGDSVGEVRGLRRYLRRRGPFVSEALVDESIGAVLEFNLVLNGQLLQRTLYGYTGVGEGRFVRTHTRIERVRGQTDRPLVMEHVLSNVRVERRGTQ